MVEDALPEREPRRGLAEGEPEKLSAVVAEAHPVLVTELVEVTEGERETATDGEEDTDAEGHRDAEGHAVEDTDTVLLSLSLGERVGDTDAEVQPDADAEGETVYSGEPE